MLKFEYCSPTKIVFGKDTEGRTAKLVKKFGGTKIVIDYEIGRASCRERV